MLFFFKNPDGTDFLVGLQCFKSKTLKVKHVQDMHISEKKSPLVSRFDFFIRK